MDDVGVGDGDLTGRFESSAVELESPDLWDEVSGIS